MGRNDHGLESIDLVELVGFGIGSAGHSGQFPVHAEIVLEGDRGERLILGLDLNAFLGLDRLMQAIGPAAAAAMSRPVNSSTMTISPFAPRNADRDGTRSKPHAARR